MKPATLEIPHSVLRNKSSQVSTIVSWGQASYVRMLAAIHKLRRALAYGYTRLTAGFLRYRAEAKRDAVGGE